MFPEPPSGAGKAIARHTTTPRRKDGALVVDGKMPTGSNPRRHLPGRVSLPGPRQVRLRARLRDTTGAGNGLPKARRIPIEMPEGAEQGGQPVAGLRGRHSNQPSSVLGLRLTPIVPAHHCLPIEQRLLNRQLGLIRGTTLPGGRRAMLLPDARQ